MSRLDDPRQIDQEGGDFCRRMDAKTGEDITLRSVWMTPDYSGSKSQKGGQNIMPKSFRAQTDQALREGRHMLKFLVQGYLEQAMIAFARKRARMSQELQGDIRDRFRSASSREMGKQNMALFEPPSLKMLSPYGRDEEMI